MPQVRCRVVMFTMILTLCTEVCVMHHAVTFEFQELSRGLHRSHPTAIVALLDAVLEL
jgi:hypothetical protein